MNDRGNKGITRWTVRGLRLVTLGLFGMALVNLGRAWQSRLNLSLLQDWQPALPPAILLALSLAWAIACLTAGWLVGRRLRWGRVVAVWLPPCYGLYSAATALFSQSPYARGRWVPTLAAWALVSLGNGWFLSQRAVKKIWQPEEQHE